jgi:hypothetical protein
VLTRLPARHGQWFRQKSRIDIFEKRIIIKIIILKKINMATIYKCDVCGVILEEKLNVQISITDWPRILQRDSTHQEYLLCKKCATIKNKLIKKIFPD